MVERLVDAIAGPTAFGNQPAAVAGQLAQLPEQTRRDVARQGEAELADAGQPEAVVGIGLLSADLPDMLGMKQVGADAGLFERLERSLPVDPGALHHGGGDAVFPEPVRHCAQTVRQRTELPHGGACRPAAGLAQAHRGGDAHLVHVEARRPRADHVHVVGAPGVGLDDLTLHQVPP